MHWNICWKIFVEKKKESSYDNYTTKLTRWGQVKNMCVGKLIIIVASDNGLLPGRRQAIIWNNAGIFLIGPLEINLGEMFIEIIIFIEENTFENASEILSISSWPQCVNDITMYEVKHTLYLLWWLWYMFLHDQGSVPLTVLPSQC